MPEQDTPYYDIPKTSAGPLPASVDSPTRVTVKDVSNFPHVSRFVRELVSVYGEPALSMVSYADRLRVYIEESSGKAERRLVESSVDLHALVPETVRQLEENARREEPQRFTRAVAAVGVARLLSAASAKGGSNQPSPVYTDERGTTVLPNLSPQVFSGTVVDRQQSRSDTYEICGVSFLRGRCVVQLDGGISDVVLSGEMEHKICNLPISSMRGALWFSGTVTRGVDGVWFAEAGGEITVQQALRDTIPSA